MLSTANCIDMAQILASGTCECIAAPMGDHGLEGYMEENIYNYEWMDADRNGKEYYRIYFESDDSNYDTCGPTVFKQHFKALPAQDNKADL